jgi:hypothetical protein
VNVAFTVVALVLETVGNGRQCQVDLADGGQSVSSKPAIVLHFNNRALRYFGHGFAPTQTDN